MNFSATDFQCTGTTSDPCFTIRSSDHSAGSEDVVYFVQKVVIIGAVLLFVSVVAIVALCAWFGAMRTTQGL